MLKIGKKLKNIRNNLNLNKAQLARSLKVTVGCIDNYENDRRKFPVTSALKLINIAKSRNLALTLDDIYIKQPDMINKQAPSIEYLFK